MTKLGNRRIAAIAVAAMIGLALVGWIAAQQIRSPAQVAADTAAPKPSAITVPIVRRTLSTTVIVRGTVRYGAARPAVLGTSKVKQGSDIVTRAPLRRAELGVGSVAMTVDGRPVFVLPGAIPMSRDMHRGLQGPDVLQLERALARLGFPPGPVDGRYDVATEAAVSSFYLRSGFDPFGPTDVQLDQLRTAEAAAATARDAHLQALNTIEQAKTATPAEVEQARVDAVAARDALDTAKLALTTAEGRVATTRSAAATAQQAVAVAVANGKRDEAQADADVAVKRAALDGAIDDAKVAHIKVFDVPLDAPPSDREAASAAARAADEAVPRAQAELNAAVATAAAAKAGSPDALRKARTDATTASNDARVALGELRRARRGVRIARSASRIASQRIGILKAPGDTQAMHSIAASALAEERRTRAEVARLNAQTSVQVPANEILFFPTLPLRVDTVKAKRGSAVSGSVMNVTSSRLTVDSSLDVSAVKLVHPGNRVTIDDQDLNIKTTGRVSQVADTPGTNRVDPSRFYFAVAPSTGVRALVGASVRLTISVRSTKGRVLAVPPNALSVGGDGDSRVQVRRGRRTEIVKVVPGLAAGGLVEVRPTDSETLAPGELVIVGSRGR